MTLKQLYEKLDKLLAGAYVVDVSHWRYRDGDQKHTVKVWTSDDKTYKQSVSGFGNYELLGLYARIKADVKEIRHE